MQMRTLGVITVCGLAAVAGGGIWALRAAERKPVEAPIEEPVEVAHASPAQTLTQPPEPEPRPAAPEPSVPAPEPAQEPEPRRWDELSEEDRQEAYERMRAEAIRRFDTDGDGELSEEERSAARAEWEARSDDLRNLMVRRYDTDGDGELSREERAAAREEGREIRQEIRDRVVPLYDADGDGELNDAERESARPAFEAEFQRLRALTVLDADGSRAVDPVELARAIIGISDQDPAFDLNRDGVTDYRDAMFATEVAKAN